MQGERSVVTLMFEGQPVRIVPFRGGTGFILKDVCQRLDLKNHRQVAHRLDDKQKGATVVDTLGGPQELNVVTEAGFYMVIFQSRKPIAKRFQDWVTEEVLPSIRRNGSVCRAENAGSGGVESAARPGVGNQLFADESNRLSSGYIFGPEKDIMNTIKNN